MVKIVDGDPAPWAFEGEALVVVGRAEGRPIALAALHRTLSPAGPFVELVTGQVVRGTTRSTGGEGTGGRARSVSRRPAFVRTPIAVSARDRAGLPGDTAAAEPATLKWLSQGRLREVYWEERGIRLRARLGKTAAPGSFPVRLFSSAGPADAYVGGRLVMARVVIEVPAGDPLGGLAGSRRGLLFSTARLGRAAYRVPAFRRFEAVAEPA